MWCDGSCMRAFHCGMASSEDDTPGSDDEGSEAAVSISQPQLQPVHCNPLQMPLDLYQRLKDTKDMFYCPNCLTGVHQCFKCKEEGVVEARAADPEIEKFAKRLVFRCSAVVAPHMACTTTCDCLQWVCWNSVYLLAGIDALFAISRAQSSIAAGKQH